MWAIFGCTTSENLNAPSAFSEYCKFLPRSNLVKEMINLSSLIFVIVLSLAWQFISVHPCS